MWYWGRTCSKCDICLMTQLLCSLSAHKGSMKMRSASSPLLPLSLVRTCLVRLPCLYAWQCMFTVCMSAINKEHVPGPNYIDIKVTGSDRHTDNVYVYILRTNGLWMTVKADICCVTSTCSRLLSLYTHNVRGWNINFLFYPYNSSLFIV